MLLLAVFFGFIVFSLVVLLVISKIADKYLQGDYIRVDEEGDEEEGLVKRNIREEHNIDGDGEGEEENVDGVGLVDIGGGMVIDFEVKTRDHYAKQRLKEIDEKEIDEKEIDEKEQIKAQESARVQATLEYEDSTHLIIGCINNLHDLQQLVKPPSTQLPHEMSFHIKIPQPLTSHKFNTKTKWRTFGDLSGDEKLELNFKLDPLKKNTDLLTSDILWEGQPLASDTNYSYIYHISTGKWLTYKKM